MSHKHRQNKPNGKEQNNEVVLGQQYPLLLARGTTFHPLKLLSVSGVVGELRLTQTTLNFKQTESTAF